MSTLCLVFVRSWIPRRLVDSYHFWTCFWAIIKSGSPQMTKRKIIHYTVRDFLLHQDGLRTKERGSYVSKVCSHCLENQIGRTVEAYIDDIVVKSKKCGDLFDNLKETFYNLYKYKMMLNPKKYVFGVSSGKLVGYMVSFRGIDANPTKVEAIKKLQPLRT
jgi:hypothetical protein